VSSSSLPPLPRVAAVLVVHNGAGWLGNVLATLARQRYPALDLVVVDNASTDDSAEILARHIPERRRLTLPRNVGFGRALNAALQNEAFDNAELIWILHDDLALVPDALARLVNAVTTDASLGAVGPKLRDWSEDGTLQEVGMTMDRFGRAETRLEPGELDQGQHDQQRPVLYVSTAGLLVRADLFRGVGGIDPRYEAFRDDLDVCWRIWLAGWRVEVVPEAVGYHVAASSRLMRPSGPARSGETRYLAERNTLATILKNYSAARLVWVLPVALLLALLKSAGFLASRRFADALAVLRAYGWNVLQLPRTLRRRRLVQSRRAISDGELAGLLAPGLPRLRSYVEAGGDWLAGGSTRALLEEEDEAEAEEEIPPGRALVRAVREHPVGAAGLALLALYVIGLVPLLGGGQLIGGQVAPWPDDAREFLRSYVAPWSGEPLASPPVT
jgi:GT2 family glycosyltransferase